MSLTKEIIVIKALEMYNAHGVEYVGVRELAKDLNIKGGNITYYFPTKNDLLQEIAQRLTASNGEILAQTKIPGLYSFLDMNRRIYINQYEYRAFFISLPLWLNQDLEFARIYREGQVDRRKSFTQELNDLIKQGYLKTLSAQEMETIFGALSATSRMWICEATVDGLIGNEDKAIKTYLSRFAGILNLVASEKGKKDIKKFLGELK